MNFVISAPQPTGSVPSTRWVSVLATPTSSVLTDYGPAQTATITFLLLDPNSVKLLEVSPINGNLTEDGTTASFFVILTQSLTAPLPVRLRSTNPAEGVPQEPMFLLQASDQLIPREVVVLPTRDYTDDDDQLFEIVLTYDVLVNGVVAEVEERVHVWNHNTDVAGLVLPQQPAVVNETGRLHCGRMCTYTLYRSNGHGLCEAADTAVCSCTLSGSLCCDGSKLHAISSDYSSDFLEYIDRHYSDRLFFFSIHLTLMLMPILLYRYSQ